MTATTATLAVTIPLTNDDCLSQNARCHHFDRAKQAKELRKSARLVTVSALNGGARFDLPDDAPIELHWTIFWARNRKTHDADGCYGVLKAAQDGICDALGIDDQRIVLRGVVQLQTTGRQSEAVAELTVGGER